MRSLVAVCCFFAFQHVFAQITPQLNVTAPSTTFRVGERIPLTLTFTAPAGSHVRVLTGYEGQRGITSPSIEVIPSSGWTDPHPDASRPSAFAGMMPAPVDVSDKPLTRVLDLNEYIRFEQPGDYAAVIRTAARQPFEPENTPAMPVAVSAPLKLHIVAPTPEWQAETLAAAVNALKERATLPRTINDTKANALYSTIAALDTDAALREMASHLDDERPAGWSSRQRIYTAALTGLPASRRPAALAAMRIVLNTPDAHISSGFLSVLINLEPSGDVPENWQRASEAAWNEIAATIPAHTPATRAEIADMLSRFNPPNEEARASLARYLAEGFHDLPPDKQSTVLQYSWQGLRSPAMLAEVQRLAQLPERKRNIPDDPDQGFTISATNELRVVALRRWYDLDPGGATAYIHQQIGTEHPAYAASDIAFLPSDPMPQFESLWGTALADGSNEDAPRLTSLLTRFGTGNAKPQVGAYVDTILSRSPVLCGFVEPSALAYLVRFDTEHARAVISRSHEKADPKCPGLPFTMIAALGNGPALEEAAIAALDQQSMGEAEAVGYLGRYGTSAARKPLEDRLQRYLAENADSSVTYERYDRSPEAMARMQNIGLGQALLQSVLAPQGWMTNPQEASALLAGCHLPQVCQVYHQLPAEFDHLQLSVTDFGRYEPVYSLPPFPGQTLDELKTKLSQLPAGTTIVLLSSTRDSSEAEGKAANAIEAAHLNLVRK